MKKACKVSEELFFEQIENYPLIKKAAELLEKDPEISALIDMAYINTVNRLNYNEHGRVHARIVAGTSLCLHSILKNHVEMTTVKDGIANLEESALITFLGAHLHDIGNSIHRSDHEFLGMILAKDILDRILPEILPEIDPERRYKIRQEVLHIIYASDYNRKSYTVEAGIVNISDGLDISFGRAYVPEKGKIDIHSYSALAIREVIISEGEEKPVRIKIFMENPAGVFQIENNLIRKMKTTKIWDRFEIYINIAGEEMKLII